MDKRHLDGKSSVSGRQSACVRESENNLVKDFFLMAMSSVYMFAFASLFVQIPGLYGDNGIQPAKLVLMEEPRSIAEMWNQISLLRLLPRVGITDVRLGMDLLCLLGALISFTCLLVQRFRNALVFFILWILYLSLFQVGQTFLWFQWDTLLLETGFLTMLVAPLPLLGSNVYGSAVSLWLIKWLAFRLMFASGVVKLTSNCPTWWGLTAMTYHYESQCIPTSLAWYFHQLPLWFHKLSTVIVFVIEIILPFLFFSPVRSQRLFSAYSQALFMLLIALTGNYNFFNLLTTVLFISILDDDWLAGCSKNKTISKQDSRSQKTATAPAVSCSRSSSVLRLLFNVVVYGAILYWTCRLFNLRVDTVNHSIESSIGFSSADLTWFLSHAVPLSIWIGIISLAAVIITTIIKVIMSKESTTKRLISLSRCVLISIISLAMFCISLVPYTTLDLNTQQSLPAAIKTWHYSTSNTLQLSHAYGLFRSMTGVGGRPEVILEGSDSMEGPWQEYNFLYKPGHTARGPPVVAPHQPRLDWQMWFAALGTYEHNPWLLNLVYRLLKNEREVVQLIDRGPFDTAAPKYMRAQLYHYHFTSSNDSSSDWWTRVHVRQYLPILWADEPGFVKYLKEKANIYKDPIHEESANGKTPYMLRQVMDTLHTVLTPGDGFNICVALFSSSIIYKIIKGWFSG